MAKTVSDQDHQRETMGVFPRFFGFVVILSILKHTFAYEKVERSLKRLMAK